MKHFQNNNNHGGDAVYGLGILGALLYYIPHAQSLEAGFWGVVKSLFWPAFVVNKIVETLKV